MDKIFRLIEWGRQAIDFTKRPIFGMPRTFSYASKLKHQTCINFEQVAGMIRLTLASHPINHFLTSG
jgi:hypothetical protein